MKILIEAKTAAETVVVNFYRDDKSYPIIPTTFWAWGLGAGEEIEIAFPVSLEPDPADDGDWVVVKVAGEEIVLDADNNMQSVYAPCKVRLKKGVTVAAVGVAMTAL